MALTIIILSTKFEVFAFTHYEDMKGNAKCRIGWILVVRGHPRSLAT